MLCCRANFRATAKNHNDDGDCIFAAKRTPTENHDVAKRHWLYTFDNIQTYITEFVDPLFVNNYKCLSFSTATDWPEAEYIVHSFKSGEVYPNAMITNIGLHNYDQRPEELEGQIRSFVKTVDEDTSPVRYIVHSVSAVRDGQCDLSECSNSGIFAYNKMVKDLIAPSKKVAAYLDFFNYTASLTDLSGNPQKCSTAHVSAKECACKRFDGIHFQRWCNYGPIVTQWDFNWLLSLGIIDLR
jgi:hypothetical protein